MSDFIMWAAGIVITGVYGLIGWVFKMIKAEIAEIREDHSQLESRFEAHRLYAAETFSQKVDLQRIEEKIIRQLDRIEDKLDKKADK